MSDDHLIMDPVMDPVMGLVLGLVMDAGTGLVIG